MMRLDSGNLGNLSNLGNLDNLYSLGNLDNLGNLGAEDGDWASILADIDTWAGILMGSPDIDPWGSLLLGRAVNKHSQSFTLPGEGFHKESIR